MEKRLDQEIRSEERALGGRKGESGQGANGLAWENLGRDLGE